MHVSVEVLTTVIAAASLLLAVIGSVFGMGAWLVKRMDALSHQSEVRTNLRFEQVDARFVEAETRTNARFDKVEAETYRIWERLDGIQHELTEVKIGLARLEGPQRRIEIAR